MADPKVNVKVGADTSEFKTKMGDVKSTASELGKIIGKFSALAAGAGLIGGIGKSLVEMGKLAASAEGVEKAFMRIGSPALLDELTKATAGTVSELELMRKAVQANNFDLPLNQLASLFAFASKRAQETGQSVDYLVESLVQGIGKKSIMVLDNLGISSTKISKELKGVGAEVATVADYANVVSKIASDSMKVTGGIVDDNKVKLQRLNAEWENMRIIIGQKLAPVLGSTATLLSDIMSKLTFDPNKFGISVANTEMTDFKKTLVGLSGDDVLGKVVDKLLEVKNTLKTLKAEKQALDSKFSNDILLNAVSSVTPAYQKAKGEQVYLTARVAEFNEVLTQLGDLSKMTRADLTAMFSVDPGVATFEAPILKSFKTIEESFADIFPNMEADAKKGFKKIAMVSSPVIEESFREIFGKLNYEFNIDPIKTKFEEFSDWFTGTLKPAILDGVSSFITDFAAGIGELAATGDGADFGKGVLKSMGKFMQQMGSLMIAYGIAQTAFAKAIKNPANPVSAGILIASGIALVAIGAAISAAAAKGPSGTASAGSAGGGGSAAKGSQFGNQQQNNKIQIYGKLVGQDVYLSSERGGRIINSLR